MEDREYIDKIILALRLKYKEHEEKQSLPHKEISIGTEKIPLQREELLEGVCSILLPSILTDMEEREKRIKYKNENRPSIIKGDSGQNAWITFQMIFQENEKSRESITVKRDKLRDDMKKIWKSYVFYDTGEVEGDNYQVAWMDFKAVSLDNNLYSFIFLFYIEEQILLGNFHCIFSQYNIWKPAILKLLTTIQINR